MACMSSEPVIEHNAAHTALLHAAGKQTQEWTVPTATETAYNPRDITEPDNSETSLCI